MTYISRKTRLLVPHWFDECDPNYLFQLNRKRSDGRLKKHTSCDDLRAWVDDEYLNYQYLLDLMTNGDFQERPFVGIMGRFIPVETLLPILCGNKSNKDGYNEKEQFGKSVLLLVEDFMRLVNATLIKLENVERIVSNLGCNDPTENTYSSSREGRRYSFTGISPKVNTSGTFSEKQASSSECPTDIKNDGASQISTTTYLYAKEDFSDEYNKTLSKITYLKERLITIQERREQLDAKIQKLLPKEGTPGPGSQVMELYSREQCSVNRLQTKIEKLMAEKGQVLNEMCLSLRHLNDLKKKFNVESRPSVCEAKRQRSSQSENTIIAFENDTQTTDPICYQPVKSTTEPIKKVNESPRRESRFVDGGNQKTECNVLMSNTKRPKNSSSQRPCSRVAFRDASPGSELDSDYFESNRMTCRNCARSPTSTENTLYLTNLRDQDETLSFRTTMSSSRSLMQSDSQRTYDVCNVNGSIPDKKFKSDTTMVEIEQTLRNYENRLNELESLEKQVEMLKKNAIMANFFKKRWLKSCAKGRKEKSVEMEKNKKEIEQLNEQNEELRNMLQTMTAKSEKEQVEIQHLKYKEILLEESQRQTKELKNQLNNYCETCETQRNRIGRLEKTISIQQEEIQKLMSHVTRMCRITEKMKESRRANKKNVQRSRSYGPELKECNQWAHGRNSCMLTSSEEDVVQSPCCYCCSRATPLMREVIDRPVSECGRRIVDRGCESIHRQHSCRRGSYYN